MNPVKAFVEAWYVYGFMRRHKVTYTELNEAITLYKLLSFAPIVNSKHQSLKLLLDAFKSD